MMMMVMICSWKQSSLWFQYCPILIPTTHQTKNWWIHCVMDAFVYTHAKYIHLTFITIKLNIRLKSWYTYGNIVNHSVQFHSYNLSHLSQHCWTEETFVHWFVIQINCFSIYSISRNVLVDQFSSTNHLHLYLDLIQESIHYSLYPRIEQNYSQLEEIHRSAHYCVTVHCIIKLLYTFNSISFYVF